MSSHLNRTENIRGAGHRTFAPGSIGARMDRLPASGVHWRLCLLTQMAWTFTLGAGYVGLLYAYVWSTDFSHRQYSWLNAVQLGVGILVGEYAGGYLGDRIGRKKTIVVGSLLTGISVCGAGVVAPSYLGLMAVVFPQAVGTGFVMATATLYQHEFVPPHSRGRITQGAQATTAFWAVLIYIVGYLLVPDHYRLYLYLLGAASIVTACALLAIPESPRWLEAKGRMTEANRVVEKIERAVQRRTGPLPEPDRSDVEHHPVVIAETVQLREIFRGEYLRRTLVVAPAWVLGYSGIVWGFFAYMGLQLEAYGFTAPQFFLVALLLYGPGYAASMLLFSLYNERFERRTQVLIGATVFSLSLALIWFFSYVHQVNAMLYLGWTLVGAGSGLWLFSMYNYTAMAYPTRLRSQAVGITDGLGHLGAIFGPVVVVALGDATRQHGFYGFMLYCAIVGALLPSLLIRLWGIEQRDASLESISE